jgi:hypothetical protein
MTALSVLSAPYFFAVTSAMAVPTLAAVATWSSAT